MALRRLAKLALAGTGLAAAFAAGHFIPFPAPQPQAEAPPADPPVVAKAEPKPEPPKPQPAKPQPPVVYAASGTPVSAPMPPAPNVFPAPAFEVPTVPAPSPLPAAPLTPPSVTPVAPLPPLPPAFPLVPKVEAVAPKPPAPPVEPEIVEPVASVHRFDGKYLGGDARHALVYAETGDGKAEVRCRPLAAAIPNADEDAPSEAKSLAVPAGKTAYHGGRAFITAPREMLVVNAECQVEWRFVLPGKADSGEALLNVAGFRDGKVLVVSNRPAADGKKPLGRVYTLDATTGEAVALETLSESFQPKTEFHLAPTGQLVAVGGSRVFVHGMSVGNEFAASVPAFPAAHAALVAREGVFVSTPNGMGIANSHEFAVLLSGSTATATPTFRGKLDRFDRPLLFAPIKRGEQFALAVIGYSDRPEWTIPVANAITAPPLLRGSSVYFVAGEVLYRADAKTGAVCWKLTLPLAPTDVLTDLTFADGGLHASGAGVLVRVADRREK